jgi:hypothetical protein
LANLVMLAAGVAAITLAVLAASSRTVALPVAASALTAGLGIAAVVMVVGRILLQPGPNGLVDLKFGIYVALIGAIAIAWGGWQAMQEEGTSFSAARDQLESRLGGEDSAARRPGAPGSTESPAAPDVRRQAPEAPSAPSEPPPSAPPPGERR